MLQHTPILRPILAPHLALHVGDKITHPECVYVT